jgi:hypothetical protein
MHYLPEEDALQRFYNWLLFHIVWLTGIESACMHAPEEDASLIYQAAVPIFTKQHSSTAHFLLLLFHIVGLAAGVESILYMCQKRIHH